jgi:predicted TIM-barrel fold metal-dependent hydrolase
MRPPLPPVGEALHEGPELAACVGCLPSSGLLTSPMPALNDEEGPRLPLGLPPVVDAHVHLFPGPLFEALWAWFDRHGWPVRYRFPAEDVLAFLFARGVQRAVGLMYAHRPGLARGMNRWMAALAGAEPRLTGLATVLPGEPEAAAILEEAFALGLAGAKLHCHVQCFAVDDAAMEPLYDVAERWGRPLLIHAGREPKSPAYACDPHAICGAERVDRVLTNRPGLRLCVPHLGADEFDAYERLLLRHDGLWLDTTMMLADYFDVPRQHRLLRTRPGRVLFGTDFPNIPYAWDREVRHLEDHGLPPDELALLLGGAAERLYALEEAP